MKDIIFFDIDTQYDFMHRNGKFYVQGAEDIIPNLGAITKFAAANNVPVFASNRVECTPYTVGLLGQL
jgi:nicotinamidase/pyrazinamidase